MTNADKIRGMTDEELADFLDTITDCCHGESILDGESISECDRCPMKYASAFCRIDLWLKQEVNQNDS